MTAAELVATWRARAAELEQLGALVNGAAIYRAVADELAQLESAEGSVLSLAAAATRSGYSQAHLARLVKDGKLTTLRPAGSRGRLTFRAQDLPRKPVGAHSRVAGVHELASRLFGGREGHHGRS
jgi:hypothetical protein